MAALNRPAGGSHGRTKACPIREPRGPARHSAASRPEAGPGGGLARHGIAGLAVAGISATAQFLAVLVVTRSLDPPSAGAFFTATAVCLMLAGILRLDTGNGLVLALAGGQGTGGQGTGGQGTGGRGTPASRAAATRRMLWGVLVPVAALSVLASVAVAVSAGALGEATGVPEGVWPVLGAALPAAVLADVLVCGTRGTGTMRPTVLLSGIAQPLAQLALVAAAVLGGAPLPVLVAAWALPSLPVAALAAIGLGRRKPYGMGDVRSFWRRTAPRSVAAAIQAVFQRLDVVIVAVLAGPAAAAVYTAATRFKVIGQLANQGLAQAAQARLVRALADGDLARAARLYQTTTIWLVALTWPIWLAYAALAPWLLPLFGPGYSGGTAVAFVLSATMMLATACGMVDVVLVASGRTAASLANTAAAVSTTVALDVLLVPGHGALGAAVGWSGGVVVKNLLPLTQVVRWYGLRPFGRHSVAALRVTRAA